MIKKAFIVNSERIELPIIGQGGIDTADKYRKEYAGTKKQIKALQYGIEQGMTFIDTAEIYSAGHSEEIVGKAIAGHRSEVIIATKFSPEHSRYQDVIDAAERSLKRLNTDYIDIYQIHWPNPSVPLEETLQAMKRLVEQGKVRFIGVSNFYKKNLEKAKLLLNNTPLFSDQLEFNLFDRFGANSVLSYCQKNNIAFLSYSPLNKGNLDFAYKRLEKIATFYNKTVSQISLNWLTYHQNVIVIVKAVKKEHIKQNAEVAKFCISADHYKEIDRLFSFKPIYIDIDNIHTNFINSKDRLNSIKLAEEILKGDSIKPIRVIKNLKTHVPFDYELVEGWVRYLAWAIAYNNKQPIPAFLIE